ncbi:MAG: GTP-binding protein [Patescibacteria group bacterium]
MEKTNKLIRNVAVIAHVDHGKTTLIDALLKQTHVFRDNQQQMEESRILDSNDQERERGITITAKNCAIFHQGVKINIIDTPGHADFFGEVERTLGMADGALLIIDAQEGPMPQTRFVLKKALELGLKPIVVINKIDKKYARIDYVLRKTESLFLELVSSEGQLDFPVLYAVGKEGKVYETLPTDLETPATVLPLLEKIIDYVPGPVTNDQKSFKMLISSFDYDPHLGKMAIGRIYQGIVQTGKKLILSGSPGKVYKAEKILVSDGLGKTVVGEARSGDIVTIAGIFDSKIGETISEPGDTKVLPTVKIGEPTLHLALGVNVSPFFGQEGEFVTSRQLESRLDQEREKNLSLKIVKLADGKFQISGRGELHLAVFLENLRREGYEMEVEKPEVIVKKVDGVVSEPIEELNIIVPNEYQGVINQEMGKRFAILMKTESINEKELEFVYRVPTRAIIGLRSILLMATKGTIILSSQVVGYQPVGKSVPKTRGGVLMASESGTALAYGLRNAQERGVTFIGPGTKVYEGMIVGENAKGDDLAINICKGKQLTNMRSKSSDGIIQLTPPRILSLEQCLDFINEDELLEITPKSLRLRKKLLTEAERRRSARK